ncbi:MAG: BlaI/MecI/CopY family transcriptional regulator [Gemmatimonadetes bacterium]|nr:BlaI/MecI/CopY family transcriptional regulator [Gemmatimonadota bacterium]
MNLRVVNIHQSGEISPHAVHVPPSLFLEHPVPRFPDSTLSRRERQIMDIIYRRGRATAAEVLDDLPDPPTNDAVRAALRLLEAKGHVQHEQDGPRYVYLPTVPREAARQSALRHLMRTFFNGSPEQMVSALFETEDVRPSGEQLDRLAELIEKVRKEEEEK